MIGARLLQSRRKVNPDGRMPLIEHIRELRARVLKAVLALAVGMAVGFLVFHPAWALIQRPFCSTEVNGATGCHTLGKDQLIISGVFDAFYLRVKVAFAVGLIISSPFWLYQFWAFIAPGLYLRERRWTYLFVGAAVPLFVGGAALAYEVMGRGLHFLFGLTPSGVGILPTVDAYLGYFLAMLLGFGLAFELPLALVMLNLAGILPHRWFRKWRRVMIFASFLFAGMATPSPDPVTMLLLAIPCVILVEVAELIIWLNDRRRGRLASPYAGLRDDELSPLDLDLDDVGGVDDELSAGRGR